MLLFKNGAERWNFTVDANGNPVANPDTLRVWLCPVMADLDDALVKAREEIDNIHGGA